MGKHRKTQHFRRMVIGAVAIGAVGVPSVALACTDWPSGTAGQSAATDATPVAPANTLVPADTPAPTDTPVPAGTAIPQQPGTPLAIPTRRAHPHHHVLKAAGAPAATPSAGTPPADQTAQTAQTAAAPASAPAATSAPVTTTPAAPASGVAAQIVQLVNAERAKAGCRPLTLDDKLTKAAQAHSADMAAHQNMSHTGSDGSDPGTRITRAGYSWSAYGENVAYGYSTAAEVMEGWMSSPGHRANILDCGFQEIGVGLAQPGSYWTQDFGTAR
ncbi:CAP domain-containing protein [Streptomyces sp. AM6-12]|uniref:CAP domain-containing protein n=1 Tax=Streptomyces sp. AM6-12 TaxID=3345149 RepID=UPI00379BF4B7